MKRYVASLSVAKGVTCHGLAAQREMRSKGLFAQARDRRHEWAVCRSVTPSPRDVLRTPTVPLPCSPHDRSPSSHQRQESDSDIGKCFERGSNVHHTSMRLKYGSHFMWIMKGVWERKKGVAAVVPQEAQEGAGGASSDALVTIGAKRPKM